MLETSAVELLTVDNIILDRPSRSTGKQTSTEKLNFQSINILLLFLPVFEESGKEFVGDE